MQTQVYLTVLMGKETKGRRCRYPLEKSAALVQLQIHTSIRTAHYTDRERVFRRIQANFPIPKSEITRQAGRAVDVAEDRAGPVAELF